MIIKFKKLDERAVIPKRATPGSAGLDLSAIENPLIYPRERIMVRTGLAVEIPHGHVGLLFSRSGMGAKKGIRLANCVGVIDADFRGELIVALTNDGAGVFAVNAGDRVAQLVVLPAVMGDAVEVEELGGTERGAGGFGHSGT